MKKLFSLFLCSLFFCVAAHADNADFRKIEDYLNNLKTLKADFVQMSSNGVSAEGKVYIAKPSKIRMEYTAPDSLLIVGNGGEKTTRTYQEDETLSGYVMDLQKFDELLKQAQKSGAISIENNVITGIDTATFEL